MRSITIELPIPPRALWPNGRVHWRTKAKLTKAHRRWAYIFGYQEMQRVQGEPFKKARIQPTFYFGTNRRRDHDNLLASCKAYFDGLADAGVVGNDTDFVFHSPKQEVDEQNPRLVLVVTEIGT